MTSNAAAPRVALIISQLSHGGAERQLVALAQALQNRKQFIPVVFCVSSITEPYGTILNESDIEWYSAPPHAKAGLPRLVWLIQKLGKARCDIIYGFLHTGNVYGGAASIWLNKPFVGSIRSVNRELPFMIRSLSRLFCLKADLVIANSRSGVEYLKHDLKVCHNRHVVVLNAISLNTPDSLSYQKLRSQWGIPEDALVVGTVSLLKEEKQPTFFIKVAAALHQLKPDVHFVWIGDGPERAFIQTKMASLDENLKEHLHFVGFRSDVAECLSTLDCFVLTSRYEGLPNALLEAMYAGKPCIATHVPGTEDVFDMYDGANEIGLLADPHDPLQFASTILGILRNPDRMADMGDHARKYVQQKYSLESVAAAHEKLFREVLSR